MKKIIIDGVSGTWEPDEETKQEFNSTTFFNEVRKNLFGGSLSQQQVDGINLIGSTCKKYLSGPACMEQTAYVLATVFHETAQTMQPIEEYGGSSARYAPWYGRGHVQLTWEENYSEQQYKLTGLQEIGSISDSIPCRVHDDMSLALHPETSALICVLGMSDGDFTGKCLDDYINSGKTDFINARRIVNGTDRAELIAGYADAFLAALKAGAGA